jgi:prefoldin subunit 4
VARAQKLLDDLEDASNEIMITEDTEVSAAKSGSPSVCIRADLRTALRQVRYVVGGSFVMLPNDDAETRLQSGARCGASMALAMVADCHCPCAATEEAGSEVERLGSERESIVKEMTRLKGVLYAKFGDAINLED